MRAVVLLLAAVVACAEPEAPSIVELTQRVDSLQQELNDAQIHFNRMRQEIATATEVCRRARRRR